MIDDPYSVLGLTPDASDEEVKRAYRALGEISLEGSHHRTDIAARAAQYQRLFEEQAA